MIIHEQHSDRDGWVLLEHEDGRQAVLYRRGDQFRTQSGFVQSCRVASATPSGANLMARWTSPKAAAARFARLTTEPAWIAESDRREAERARERAIVDAAEADRTATPITVAVDFENAAARFWNQPGAPTDRGDEFVATLAEWKAWQRLPGFADGPAHAPTALVLVEE